MNIRPPGHIFGIRRRSACQPSISIILLILDNNSPKRLDQGLAHIYICYHGFWICFGLRCCPRPTISWHTMSWDTSLSFQCSCSTTTTKHFGLYITTSTIYSIPQSKGTRKEGYKPKCPNTGSIQTSLLLLFCSNPSRLGSLLNNSQVVDVEA